MRKLNAEYRQKNAPTNVLSFPAPRSMRIKGVLRTPR
ncbi:MAG: rRNA maturation RNAse YbeY [Asticcacaulis sp.]